jgi:deoxycytidylate deaminase
MYCTHFPCPDCARGIIQSGITSLYYPEDRSEEGKKFRERTYQSQLIALEMLKEAGVQCIIFQQSSSPSGQTTIFSTHKVKPEDLMP